MSGGTDTPRRMEPPASDVAAPFWDASREQRLMVQWCRSCDAAVFFPRVACPACLGDDLEWRQSSGTGRVLAVTVEHRMPDPAGGDGPYAVALVDVDEGWRLLTNVVGADPETIAVGTRVTVCWEPLSDGRHLPQFTPVEA